MLALFCWRCAAVMRANEAYPTDNAAEVISNSSLVMLACRSLLYSKVRSLINWLALSVAFFMESQGLCSV